MAEITAAMVKNLRERSGLPMMDCKNALTETGGDAEKALELLRKRGAMAAEKKAGRETAEGRIGVYLDKEKGVAALVELLCETAPVANNPMFKELADKLAYHVAMTGCTDAAALGGEKFAADPATTVVDLIHDAVNRLRENMQIGRIALDKGLVATYIHHTGKHGVLLTVEGAKRDDELMNDVCMQIAAMRPDAVNREEVPAAVISKEEEIAREQVLQSGKPENLVDKILKGKMDRWFGEHVLVEQAFVKDDKKKVGQVLQSAGLTAKRFAHLVVGEG